MVAKDNKDSQRRLALLIDADNAQASVIEGLLAEVAKFGVASVRRIYGDFTSPGLKSWKALLLKHSIQPVQQFAYTSGKNATDSSLIIDAMDLMHTGRFDGFCLVSSDSDFTRLAQRLRESGLIVFGFGEKKTPDPFVQACDKFIYTELLRGEPSAQPPAAPPEKVKSSAPKAKPATPPNASKPEAGSPVPLIHQAIEDAQDESGWAFLGTVGNYITKIRPDFDARLFGHKKLSDLIRAYPREFEIEERGPQGSHTKTVHVRAAQTLKK